MPLLLVIAALSTGGGSVVAQNQQEPRNVELVVRVERGDVLSRVTVSVRNSTDRAFTFRNGSRGGAGSLDDGFRLPKAGDNAAAPTPRGQPDLRAEMNRTTTGTAPTVIPEIEFDRGGMDIVTLRPPSFGGPTRRDGRPAVIAVPAGDEVMYASFAVPTIHLGQNLLLIHATMRLEDGTVLSTGQGADPTTRGAG